MQRKRAFCNAVTKLLVSGVTAKRITSKVFKGVLGGRILLYQDSVMANNAPQEVKQAIGLTPIGIYLSIMHQR